MKLKYRLIIWILFNLMWMYHFLLTLPPLFEINPWISTMTMILSILPIFTILYASRDGFLEE